jgi:hypothetical protein
MAVPRLPINSATIGQIWPLRFQIAGIVLRSENRFRQGVAHFDFSNYRTVVIRPVYANVLPLALMNSARLDLNRQSASKEPLHRPGSQDDGLTCLVINRYCVLATC